MKNKKYRLPTIKEIVSKVFVVAYDNQYDLCMSFVRVQEFYESQRFKGKYFTLEEYMRYWAKDFGNGSFNYPSLWNGFNVPGKVIGKWNNLFSKHEELRDLEYDLLDLLEEEVVEKGYSIRDVYVIGVHTEEGEGEREEVIEHELAHALYCLYPEYQKSWKKLLKKMSKKKYGSISNTLTKMGYGKNVLNDEIQAYLSTGLDRLGKDIRFQNNFNEFREKIGKNKC